jgi:hypothetical protein
MAKSKKPEVKAKEKENTSHGRPSLYSEELGERICNIISTSNFGLRKICEDLEFPAYDTVTHWLMKQEHPFIQQYARAKEQQAEYLADEMMEIADDCPPLKFHVDKAKLQVETRKWIASKLKAKKYGDKITQEHTGKDGAPIQIENQEMDLSGLTEEELLLFKQLTAKMATKKDSSESK